MSYNLGTASGRIEIDGKGASKGFDVARTAADGFFGAIKAKVSEVENLGKRLAVAGGAGVTAFGFAIKTAASFEKQMSGVAAVTNSTEREFESLRDKAMQLGADTTFSASEAALAIEELAKAGIPVEDILKGAADGAVALAAAGGVGLAEAATIASNAMNQFEIDSSKVTEVADILAGVANTSAADVSSLGQSLSQAGAVAHLAGLDFRDTAIALGEMADAGINGSDAGTALKTMLNNLIPTTKAQTTEFQELGLLTQDLATANKTLAKVTGGSAKKSFKEVNKELAKYIENSGKGKVGTVKNADAVQKLLMRYGGLNNQFFDAQGNVKNLRGLQDTLGESLKGMTRQQKLASLELLFGADAMRASAILSLAGAEGYDKFSDSVSKTSAAEVAKVRLDNLDGSIEALKGSIETAAITIGSIMLPIITKFVQGLTFLVNAFNSLPGPIKTAIGIIAAVVSVVLLLTGVLLASITTIAAFVLQWYAMRVIKVATSWLRAFIATQRGGAGAAAAFRAANAAANASIARTTLLTKIATKALLLFRKAIILTGKAMKFLMNPWVLLIAAIIVGLVILYKKWEPFRELVDQTAASIKNGLTKAWQAMQPAIKAALAILREFGSWFKSNMLPIIKQVAAVIYSQLLSSFKEISGVIKSELMPALRELASNFQKNILPALKDLWDRVGPIAKVIGTVLVGAMIAWLKILTEVWKVILGAIIPALAKFIGFIAGPAIRVLTAWITGIIHVVTGIVKVFSGLIKIVKDIFTGDWSKVWEGAKQILSGFLDILKGLFEVAFAGIIGVLKSWGSQIGNFFKGIFQKIFGGGGGGSGPLTPLVNFFKTAFGIIAKTVQVGLAIVKGVFEKVLKPLFAFWITFWKAVGTVLGPLLKLIFTIFSVFFKIVYELFKAQFTIIKAVVMLALQGIIALIKLIWGGLVAIFGPPLRLVIAIVRGAWAVIKALTGAAFRAVKAIITPIIGAIVSFISGRLAAIRNNFSTVWNALKGIVSGAFTRVKAAVKTGIDNAKKVMDTLKSKILDPITNLGSEMYNAGKKLMEMLAGGIAEKIGAVTGKIEDLGNKIGKLLPGSPVREGPLKSFNRGKVGVKLMDMLAYGLSQTGAVEDAMRKAAKLVDGYAMTATGSVAFGSASTALGASALSPTALTPSVPRTAKKGAAAQGGTSKSRLFEGHLAIDDSGRAWISGLASDEDSDHDDYDDTLDRMNR